MSRGALALVITVGTGANARRLILIWNWNKALGAVSNIDTACSATCCRKSNGPSLYDRPSPPSKARRRQDRYLRCAGSSVRPIARV